MQIGVKPLLPSSGKIPWRPTPIKLFRTIFVLALLTAAIWGYLFLAPYGPSTETFVDIPAGTNASGMASRLKQAGVIRSRLDFLLLRHFKGGRLLAGEYRFDHPAPLTQVYTRIARGDVYTIPLAIPEGFNLFDIAQAVQTAGLGNAQTFLAASRRNTSLIADLSPRAPSLEGYLFPDTYRFSRHTTQQQMLATMVKRFRQQAAALNLTSDIPRTVTLASLIEKEVHVESERPLVAGVFRNRLTLGMPLQTDPSVIYAALLDSRWRGTIYQSDLANPNHYNTYRNPGLPPGPVANPGIAALKAAMHPAQTDALYFVADSQGHSVFSKDLKQHLAAVQAYRNAQHSGPNP